MKRPWVYMSSPSRSPLPPPSPPAPSRSSQSTRSEHLSHASNLGWWSVPPSIIDMIRCCSLETSHPRLLPQSLKDSSINLCLFFCSAYRVMINIFLNSIYMCKIHILNMNNHMNTAKNQGKQSGRMDIEGEEIESTRVLSCLLILLIMLTCSLSYNF